MRFGSGLHTNQGHFLGQNKGMCDATKHPDMAASLRTNHLPRCITTGFDDFAFVGDMSKRSEKSVLPDLFLEIFHSAILPSFCIY